MTDTTDFKGIPKANVSEQKKIRFGDKHFTFPFYITVKEKETVMGSGNKTYKAGETVKIVSEQSNPKGIKKGADGVISKHGTVTSVTAEDGTIILYKELAKTYIHQDIPVKGAQKHESSDSDEDKNAVYAYHNYSPAPEITEKELGNFHADGNEKSNNMENKMNASGKHQSYSIGGKKYHTPFAITVKKGQSINGISSDVTNKAPTYSANTTITITGIKKGGKILPSLPANDTYFKTSDGFYIDATDANTMAIFSQHNKTKHMENKTQTKSADGGEFSGGALGKADGIYPSNYSPRDVTAQGNAEYFMADGSMAKVFNAGTIIAFVVGAAAGALICHKWGHKIFGK